MTEPSVKFSTGTVSAIFIAGIGAGIFMCIFLKDIFISVIGAIAFTLFFYWSQKNKRVEFHSNFIIINDGMLFPNYHKINYTDIVEFQILNFILNEFANTQVNMRYTYAGKKRITTFTLDDAITPEIEQLKNLLSLNNIAYTTKSR